MISVKDSRRFHGGPISLSALADLEQWRRPVSVRQMAELSMVTGDGEIRAEDVSCRYKVTLYSNGNWNLSGSFSDTGGVVGDYFELSLIVNDMEMRGASLDGRLDAGGYLDLVKRGNDVFIREHWQQIHADGPGQIKLQASWDVGQLIGLIGMGLAIAASAIFFGSGGKKGVRRCPDQPFDDHTPCIEYFNVE